MKVAAGQTLLAVDTANGASSLVLWHAGELVHNAQTEGRDNLAWLRTQTQMGLAAADLGLADIDVLAVNTGPGAMTGLRVGVGFVQALAMGVDAPVVPVNTLQNLLLAAIESGHCATMSINVALDARLGELYAARYAQSKSGLETLAKAALQKPLAAMQAEPDGHFAGPGWEAYREHLDPAATLWPGCLPHARHVAKLAQGQTAIAAQSLRVNYLREQVARIPQRLQS